MKYLVYVFLCILSGILYHLGGTGGAWWKNSKVRDVGVSICTILCIALYKGWHWAYIPLFLLSWGALSTYWKKGADCKWYHWLAHGLGVGLACFPLIWVGIAWWLIVARAILLGLAMMAVSEWSDDVRVEEIGRGGLIILTLLLFSAK